MTEGRKNRLIHESSPYLLQHADNPVDWYPWGPEAFERARVEDKPVMLSVGYSACHWCHVMERESFADAEVARLLNDGFVCVKVDREERPDVDEVYMAATVAMSGHGGWPMTVFMNAEGQPFFAGTYFPKHDAPGRIGLCTLLARIGELWQQDRARLEEHGRELARALEAATREQAPKPIAPEAPARAVRALLARFDSRYGGFGQAPKFPPASTLRFLLELHQKTGEPELLAMVRGTLDGMKNGGIYDHVGGGFCRYSTDERWLVPHFEKMLYDNAQLASVYLDAFQVTKDPEYERVARETLDYAAREMQDAGGGYYSATDADSEGEEGKFYVFYYDELLELLGPELGALFAAYYGASPEGNWEGKNVLNTPRPLAELAERFGVSEEIARARLAEARARVYERRRTRVPPALDDKILASWNGLMIGAMAEGARVLGEPRYLRSAERAAEFVAMHMRRADGGLYRSARHGRAKLAAYLEDYAFLGDGLLSLYEAGGGLGQGALGKEGGDGAGFGAPEALLLFVKELAERLLLDFEAKEGGFYHTAHAHERLLLRPKEGHDGALPSANAVAARLLARMSPHLDWRELRDHAARAIESFGATIERAPEAFPTALGVLERLAAPPTEIVVVGERGAPDFDELTSAAADVYLPFAARVVVDARVSAPPARRVPLSPLTRDKKQLDGRAALYVCHDYRCEAPIDDASAARAALTALAPGAPSSTARTAPRTAEPAPRFR